MVVVASQFLIGLPVYKVSLLNRHLKFCILRLFFPREKIEREKDRTKIIFFLIRRLEKKKKKEIERGKVNYNLK